MPRSRVSNWLHKTRTRLIAAAVLATLLPVGVFYWISVDIAASALVNESSNSVENLVEHASVMITQYVQSIAHTLRPSAYEPDPASLSSRNLDLYLSFILRQESALDSASYIAESGKEVARMSRRTVYKPNELRDFSTSKILDTVRQGRIYYGEPYISEIGEPRMQIAVAIPGQQLEFHGALLVSASLRKLLNEVSLRFEKFQYVFIVNKAGTLIAHPDFSLVLERKNMMHYKVVSEALAIPRGQDTPFFRYKNALGQDVLGMGWRNRFLGWGIIGEVTTDQALAGVRDLEWTFGIIFGSVALAAIIGAWILGDKAAKRIQKLRETVLRIGEGDFSQQVALAGAVELEEFAFGLNRMTDRLREYSDHLEQDKEELNRMVEQRTQSLRQAYEELKARDRELKEAQTAMVQTEKMAAMGRLVAGVVHEVNNPLAYIIGNVEVLRRDYEALAELLKLYSQAAATDQDEQRHETLHEADDQAEEIDLEYTLTSLDETFARTEDGLRTIRKIVQDLRDFSRAGEAPREEIDLNKAVETTLSIVAYDLRKNNIEAITDLGEVPNIKAASVKISQVILNIVLNAIQAIGRQGHIWMATRREGEMATLIIRDDGPGIPQEVLDKVFDPFFTTKKEGTGLGLSVSYGIIREHNGTISVRNHPEGGAEFVIKLPVNAEKQEAESEQNS